MDPIPAPVNPSHSEDSTGTGTDSPKSKVQCRQDSPHKGILKADSVIERYSPAHVTVLKEVIDAWLAAPVTGDLTEVPGVGSVNQGHLMFQHAATTGDVLKDINLPQAEKDPDHVTNTHQLLGKYLMFRGPGVSNVDNANLFFAWLKLKGVLSHDHDITKAVALKLNALMGGGIYDEADFMEK